MQYFQIKNLLLTIFLVLFVSRIGVGQNDTISQTSVEQAILNDINAVRKNPQSFIPLLENYKKLMKGNVLEFSKDVRIVTFEGSVAIDDAIEFLKTSPKLGELKFSKGLAKPAKAQLDDLLENSSLGHFGKDGSNLPKRLAKFGTHGFSYAENITYRADSPRDIVLMMIVDDGNKNRGHRKNLFSRLHREVGIAYGVSNKKEAISVTVFANFFREFGAKSGLRQF